MFKIGEFSKLTQVSIRMLRYYDEAGLLKPARIDPWTGYRLYSVEQIPIVQKICYLRDSGFSVAQIAAALHIKDERALLELLDAKRAEIQRAIAEEQVRLEKIRLAKEQMKGAASELPYNFAIKAIPAYQVLSYRKIVPDYYAEGDMWKRMAAYMEENKVEAGDTFTIFHDLDYRESDVDVELCVQVKAMGQAGDGFAYRVTQPVPAMACTMVYGDFSGIGGAYRAFAQWLQNNAQYRMAGPTRQIVHRGPWNEDNSERYLTELQIPLEVLTLP